MDLPPPSQSKNTTFKDQKIKVINPAHLGNLALDIWRLRNRLSKLNDRLDQESLKPVFYYIESCERNLVELGIETKDDYTNELYKSSMNVDVVTYESIEMDGDEARVKETLEPAILIHGELYLKAKVVVATPKA